VISQKIVLDLEEAATRISPSCVIPLQYCAQLVELQQEIRCPDNLVGVPSRIEEARLLGSAEKYRRSQGKSRDSLLLKKRLLGMSDIQGVPARGRRAH
jgi:hypothetical protein